MRLIASVLLVVGLIFGVVEANNPMPTPDYDEVCLIAADLVSLGRGCCGATGELLLLAFSCSVFE